MKELNLIPYSIREKQEKIIKIRNIAASFVIFLCILFVGIYIPNMYLNVLEKNETALKEDIDKNSYIMEETKNVENQLVDYNEYFNKINTLSEKKILISDRLQELAPSFPKDVAATNINYNKGIISIIGVTSNHNSISEFAANLQMTKKYSEVRIMNEAYNKEDKNYIFTINITY